MRRLRAVRPVEVDGRRHGYVAFCGHCGVAPARDAVQQSRVCGRCGLGLNREPRQPGAVGIARTGTVAVPDIGADVVMIAARRHERRTAAAAGQASTRLLLK